MEITGRLTADAVVRTVSEERKVVGFSIVINDTFRSNGEQKKITTFIDCSYWLNTGIAEYLKKGGWVQLYGRIGVNAYMSGNNEAKASLTFHTSEIKLLGGAAPKWEMPNVVAKEAETVPLSQSNSAFEGIDDVPF